MGNTNSNVTSGVKDQASGVTKKLYNFIDLQGGGELVHLMKKANRTKNYFELDRRIREGLLPFLYNGGNGRIAHVSELIQARVSEKGIQLGPKKQPYSEDLDEVKEMEAVVDGGSHFLKQHGRGFWLLVE